MEEFLGNGSMRSMSRLYNRRHLNDPVWRHVEAGWNNSIVSLRVVRGDEKAPSAWGYNWAALSLGDINNGDLSLK
jgi:hypothetical protein